MSDDITITPRMIDWEDDGPVVTVAGSKYLVHFEDDYDSNPFDADCYSPEDVEAWRHDAWRYIEVSVMPLDVPESMQFELSGSLWGVEFYFPLNPPLEHNGKRFTRTGEDYMIMVHPVPDLISEVQGNVRRWKAKQAYDNHVNS